MAEKRVLRAEGDLPLTWNSVGSLSKRQICPLKRLHIGSDRTKSRRTRLRVMVKTRSFVLTES